MMDPQLAMIQEQLDQAELFFRGLKHRAKSLIQAVENASAMIAQLRRDVAKEEAK
jgi:ABC-type transporter Mla subunit MlaD